ncbi:uncharacterized protein JCM6883_003503 [Sporobolomyces salmoneus]|uniref:uncharacterized protein n=1 Tax=Sporobolomyces salmoneus TaxID=183962 RepID=UPI0031759E6A
MSEKNEKLLYEKDNAALTFNLELICLSPHTFSRRLPVPQLLLSFKPVCGTIDRTGSGFRRIALPLVAEEEGRMGDDPLRYSSSASLPFGSRATYDQGTSTSQLANFAGSSTEMQYGAAIGGASYSGSYPGSRVPSPQSSCACLDCHEQSRTTNELHPLRRQPQINNPFFSQSAQFVPPDAPIPYFYGDSSTSTPYDYPDTASPSYYIPSQAQSQTPSHRPTPSIYQYESPSATTTPLPTPPTQSPCYFPSNPFYPAENPGRTVQRSNPIAPLPLPMPFSYESASVSQSAPTDSSSELLAPPVKSQSYDERFGMRSRENSGSSLDGASFRRRSSTLSLLSVPEGPNSDTSDGGDGLDRPETITPFVSKLAYLLRENTPWIRWNAEGTAFFFAHHRDEFGDQLSRVFRHGSSHSFVRQLNIYNFKRLSPAEIEQTVAGVELPPGLISTDFAAFAHPLFYRDASCDLTRIKPKTPRKVSSKLSLRSSSSQAPSPRNLRSEGKIGGLTRPKY